MAEQQIKFERVNLFLIGAAKAGTSSLWSWLSQHDDIFSPSDELYKEPCYFSGYGASLGIDAYSRLYEAGANRKYRMDASTAYLTSPESASLIYSYNPQAKIIVVLRDPVDRAYSLYNWMVQDGYEWAASFEKALELEPVRKKKKIPCFSAPQYYWNYLYLESGLYCQQLDRYSQLFENNMLILNFSDLVVTPLETLKKVYAFLGVDEVPVVMNRENPSKGVLSPYLSFMARKVTRQLSRIGMFRWCKTKRCRDFLLDMLTVDAAPKKLSPQLRNELRRYYYAEFDCLRKRYQITFD